MLAAECEFNTVSCLGAQSCRRKAPTVILGLGFKYFSRVPTPSQLKALGL